MITVATSEGCESYVGICEAFGTVPGTGKSSISAIIISFSVFFLKEIEKELLVLSSANYL